MAIISYCCSKIKRFTPKKFSCNFVKIIQVSTHFTAFSIASVNFKRFFRQSAREDKQKICQHPLTKMPAYLCTFLLKFVVVFSQTLCFFHIWIFWFFQHVHRFRITGRRFRTGKRAFQNAVNGVGVELRGKAQAVDVSMAFSSAATRPIMVCSRSTRSLM